MQSERFVVRCITANNCFAYLHDGWLRKLETKENVIEISHNDQTYYVSCVGRSNPDGTLCLGTTFARSLNINDGDEVFVSSVKDVRSLVRITVVPHSANDREILEIQMEKVQSTLLNQIRVAAKDQAIVVWVSKFSCIALTTESLDPDVQYGKLEQFTEVHVANVAPGDRSKAADKESDQNSSVARALRQALKRVFPGATTEAEKKQDQRAKDLEFLRNFKNKSKPLVCRVHPLPVHHGPDDPNVESNGHDEVLRSPYHVFLPKSHVPRHARLACGFATFRVTKVPEERSYASVTGASFLGQDEAAGPKLSTGLVVKLHALEDVLENCSSAVDRGHFNFGTASSNVYASESLRISLKLRIGGKVILRHVEAAEKVEPSSIEIFPWKGTVTVASFRRHVEERSRHGGFLVNSCAAVVLDDGARCLVRLSPANCTFAEIDGALLRRLVVHLRAKPTDGDARLFEDPAEEQFCAGKISTRYLKNVLEECRMTLDLSLGLRSPLNSKYERENILICGEAGSGKTTVCKVLVENLQRAPYFVHTHAIDCRSLKGKKVEMLQKLVTAALAECSYYEPSVLFLDDIESITNASANDEESTPDATNAARIADMLVNTVTQYQESHYVSIIGTCASVNRIGQKLRPARGAHFFRTVLSIPNLEKVDRIDILQLMLGDKLYVSGDVNWDYYGNKTEGWMAQDLVDMAEKATFAAWKRHERSEPPVVVEEEDVSVALSKSTPMSLQGIQLYKGSGHVWSDIGGLAQAKRSLIEILQWPLKYPEIFKNAPIKLQNGVLLYGMPGTGKTMLAKAIANECAVNIISVKGPELLSKYIGVSEESVRNVFERARRAKPCVLFFDEFDSLAPRRGHDSTGVTDRVVNQLLTQLDGVEDREGVAVVAASSRPDLLDPALLRPGRLDKALHCPLPNETDREDILTALCKSQNVDTMELDLKELAELSSGFTGADLNAVVTQARLSAFEDAVAASPDGKVEPADVKVAQGHLVDSVKSTHPSLSASEKRKYNKIYSRFSKGENFTEEILRNQRSTLA